MAEPEQNKPCPGGDGYAQCRMEPLLECLGCGRREAPKTSMSDAMLYQNQRNAAWKCIEEMGRSLAFLQGAFGNQLKREDKERLRDIQALARECIRSGKFDF